MSPRTRDDLGEMASTAPHQESSHLKGGAVGLFGTTSSTLANMAPALGVFLTIPVIVGGMGTMAPWAFVPAAAAILATGNSLIEFTRRMPSAGGFVSFVTRGVGGRPGAFVGAMSFYLLAFVYPVSLGSVVAFFGSWTTSYLGWPDSHWVWLALGATVATLPLLLRGAAVSARAAFALFLTEAAVILVLSVIVLIRAHGAVSMPLHAEGGTPGGLKGIAGLSFTLAVFGFIGWETSGPLGEETRDPRRTIPRTVILCVAIIAAIYVLAAWALVSGFTGWQGATGIDALLSDTSSPFLTLSRHFTPWLTWLVFGVGLTSSLGCVLAAGLPASRYLFHGARAGLLPKSFATLRGSARVPVAAVALYIGGIMAVTVLLDLFLHAPSAAVSGDAAGISTVPLLVVYALTCLALPPYIWRVDRAAFSLLRHLLFPLIGVAVVGYGIWQSLKPGQPAPYNSFWIFVLIYLAVAATAALIAVTRKPGIAGSLALGLDDA